MSLLDRLERRFGGAALPNVVLWLVAGQVMVFAAQFVGPLAQNLGGLPGGGAPAIYERLALDASAVLEGEWWRLLTFPFLGALGRSPLFVLFYFYILYLLGTSLEGVWGAFKLNAYLLLGYAATVAAVFASHAIRPGAGFVDGDYLYLSLFLAFARFFPDVSFLLFFILPVKVKWLAALTWAFQGLLFVGGDWATRLAIGASVANFLVFFAGDLVSGVKSGARRAAKAAKPKPAAPKLVHECRVCGLTSEMDPKMTFRYCSKCEGQQCYCAEHLHSHECV